MSDYALRGYSKSNESNCYQATFKTSKNKQLFYLENKFNVNDLEFLVFPLDIKKHPNLRSINTKNTTLCIYGDDQTLINETRIDCGLNPRFRIPEKTKTIYLCIGDDQEKCFEILTLFLAK